MAKATDGERLMAPILQRGVGGDRMAKATERLDAPRSRGGQRSGAGANRKRDYSKLVITVQADLAVLDLPNSPKMVRSVIRDRQSNDPEFFPTEREDNLVRYYFRYHDKPAANPRDHCVSLTQKWGMSQQAGRELVDRLIKLATAAHRRGEELFYHMDRRRHWTHRQKLKWLQDAAQRLERNRFDWPVPPTRRGRPDINAGLVLAVLEKGPAPKDQIGVETGIAPDTLKTLLTCMYRAEEIDRTRAPAPGRPTLYVIRSKGLGPRVPTASAAAAILGVLADGPANLAEISARTGKHNRSLEKQIRRLTKSGNIIVAKRPTGADRWTTYALAGTAPPDASARDVILDALRRSDRQTAPELAAATAKKLGAIRAALQQLEADGMVERVGLRSRCAVFALTVHGRRWQPRVGCPQPDRAPTASIGR
jgi:hypothetical protein